MSSSIARYEAFLLKNVSTISSLESSLRSITWFLPGRFKDAELASEALTSFVNVITMYHDTLLARLVQSDKTYRPLIPPSPHTRFTRAWSVRSHSYKWAARALQLIKYIELLVEMGLRRKFSSKSRWRAVLLLEMVKTCLRFTLLIITQKPLLYLPIPEREFDPVSVASSGDALSQTPSFESSEFSRAYPEHLNNNHTPFPPHDLLSPRAETGAEEYLLPKALATSSVKPYLSLVKSLSSPTDWIAESMYILRPLIYASLLISNPRSNRSIILTLLVELAARGLRRIPLPSATLERAEYARRDRDILWYLLRGSIWQSYTRVKLQTLATAASQTPVFGILGAFIHDWIPLIDEYYYYTAP